MLRILALTTLTSALLLIAESPAAALDSCTCASILPLPASMLSLSLGGADELVRPLPAAPTSADGLVLWCEGGLDPRCMPAHPNSDPSFELTAPSPLALEGEAPRRALEPSGSPRLALESSTPPEGARGRVERPPEP